MDQSEMDQIKHGIISKDMKLATVIGNSVICLKLSENDVLEEQSRVDLHLDKLTNFRGEPLIQADINTDPALLDPSFLAMEARFGKEEAETIFVQADLQMQNCGSDRCHGQYNKQLPEQPAPQFEEFNAHVKVGEDFFITKPINRSFEQSFTLKVLPDHSQRLMLCVGKRVRHEPLLQYWKPQNALIEFNGKIVKQKLDHGKWNCPFDITKFAKKNTNTLTVTVNVPKTKNADHLAPELCVYAICLVQQKNIKLYLESFKVMNGIPHETTQSLIIGKLISLKNDRSFIPLEFDCPISGKRIQTPIRSTLCDHAQCFDADAFLKANAATENWECPVCENPIRLRDLKRDDYFMNALYFAVDFTNCLTVSCRDSTFYDMVDERVQKMMDKYSNDYLACPNSTNYHYTGSGLNHGTGHNEMLGVTEHASNMPTYQHQDLLAGLPPIEDDESFHECEVIDDGGLAEYLSNNRKPLNVKTIEYRQIHELDKHVDNSVDKTSQHEKTNQNDEMVNGRDKTIRSYDRAGCTKDTENEPVVIGKTPFNLVYCPKDANKIIKDTNNSHKSTSSNDQPGCSKQSGSKLSVHGKECYDLVMLGMEDDNLVKATSSNDQPGCSKPTGSKQPVHGSQSFDFVKLGLKDNKWAKAMRSYDQPGCNKQTESRLPMHRKEFFDLIKLGLTTNKRGKAKRRHDLPGCSRDTESEQPMIEKELFNLVKTNLNDNMNKFAHALGDTYLDILKEKVNKASDQSLDNDEGPSGNNNEANDEANQEEADTLGDEFANLDLNK